MERRLLAPPSEMLDREKVVAVLTRRFPASSITQVAAAANAIVGLEDEWVEVSAAEGGWDHQCDEECPLKRLSREGAIKLFRRVDHGH